MYTQETVIGIDPGLKGAIVVCCGNEIKAHWAMPIDNGEVSIPSLLNILYSAIEMGSKGIVMEQMIAMPGQSSKATVTTGKNWGIVYAIAKLLYKDIVLVSPMTWIKWVHGLCLGRGVFDGDSKSRSKKCFDKLIVGADKVDFGTKNKALITGFIDATLMCQWYMGVNNGEFL